MILAAISRASHDRLATELRRLHQRVTSGQTMDLYDVMHTTFAARDFVDEAVPDTVIRRILDHARFAASGGNRQGWKVIVVRNAATREALVPLMASAVQRYVAQVRAGESPWNTINPTRLTDAEIAAGAVPEAMIRKLTHAPVVLFVFVDLALVACNN